MLNLLIPSIILLWLPKKSNSFSWFQITPTLIILTFFYIVKVLQFYSTQLSLSPYSNIDSLSGALIILSIWITCLTFPASTKIKTTNNNPDLFSRTIIILILILIICFYTSNLILFYIWFEASLVPTMYLIILWGYQPERIQASLYLIIYTVIASIPLLILIIIILKASNTLTISYPFLILPQTLNPYLLYSALFLAFLVKLPLFLTHLWLPKAHVEAPVAGSIILAAILLKLGGYGLIRATNIFPYSIKLLSVPLIRIALIGAIFTRLICLRQTDLKSIIAYSSISHIGLICAGTISTSNLGLHGAVIIIIAHGLSSSALFCISNITYEATHSRRLTLTNGILTINPITTIWWFLLICINMAAPPSINLLSEIILIIASISFSSITLIPIIFIRFINVAYSLFIYAKINHGHPLNWSNSIIPISSNYNILIILHLLPGLIIILAPTLII